MRKGLLATALFALPILTLLSVVPMRDADAAPTVVRYSGPDRFATAAAVSAARFTAPTPVVHIASGSTFADALAAGPVAGSAGGPVLLVPRDSIPPSVDQELRRLRPSRLVIAGGTAAISGLVEAQLHQYTPGSVERISGSDRFATAAALSSSGFGPGTAMAFVTTGANFADALSASAAGVDRGPVLLSTRDALPEATAAELRRLRPGTIAVVGGPAAVSDAVIGQLRPLSSSGRVDRLAGPDRFATAAAVSSVFSQAQTDEVFVATGRDFPDALAAGAAAGRARAPLLLAEPSCMPGPTRAETIRIDPLRVVLLGGTAVLGDQVGTLAECGPPPVGLTTLATGLEAPWDVAFVPGGAAYITERDSGRLLRRDPNGSIAEVQRFVVDRTGEGGLLGLAASPDFGSDGLLYVFLTSASDNRIIRFRPGEPGMPILTGLPKASVHDAGRIAFGPDGMLYAATGDAGTPARSQDPASNAGKILRLRPDGGVPADNPRQGSLVYALGFRDPQGIAWDSDGRLYADEFGPDRDDEVNLVVPNGNYGWPTVTGVARDPRFVDPIVVRQPAVASWSGNAVLKGGAIPQWEGDLFVAALRGQRLYRFDLSAEGAVTGVEELFSGQLGRLRHVEQAPDGSLWILTSNRDGRGSPGAEDDRILRLGT